MRLPLSLALGMGVGVLLATPLMPRPTGTDAMLGPNNDNGGEITKMADNDKMTEVYYEEGVYNLVVTRNFSKINNVLENVTSLLDRLMKDTVTDPVVSEKRKLCYNKSNRRVKTIMHRLQEIKDEAALDSSWEGFDFWETAFVPPQSTNPHEDIRKKRGIRWLGTAWKWMSDSPDGNDWERNIDTLKKIIQHESQHDHLFKVVMDEEGSIIGTLNKTVLVEKEMEKRLSTIYVHSKQFEEWSKVLVNLEILCDMGEEILEDAEAMLREMESIVQNARTNTLSTAMMDRKTLEETLDHVPRMGALVPLWEKKNAYKYYWNPISRTLHKNLVMATQIRIPLINPDMKMTMYPTAKDNGEKILLDEMHSTYRYLSAADKENCQLMEGNEMICRGRSIQIKDATTLCTNRLDCSMGRQLPFDRVIELDRDTIAYRFKEETDVIMRCTGERNKRFTLNTTGIMLVPPHCSMAGGEFAIKKRSKINRGVKFVTNDWELQLKEEEVDNTLTNITQELRALASNHSDLTESHLNQTKAIHTIQEDVTKLEEGLENEMGEQQNDTIAAHVLEVQEELVATRNQHTMGLAIGNGTVMAIVIIIIVGFCWWGNKYARTVKGINVRLGLGLGGLKLGMGGGGGTSGGTEEGMEMTSG